MIFSPAGRKFDVQFDVQIVRRGRSAPPATEREIIHRDGHEAGFVFRCGKRKKSFGLRIERAGRECTVTRWGRAAR
jgi:hypothetical protein